VARLAVRAGRATGVTQDPSKLRRATKAWMPLGRRVAIVGGGLVGAELAEFLAERGREVVVLEAGPVIASEMAHPRRWRVLHDLREAGVRLVTGAEVLEIGERSVQFRTEDGSEVVEADSVVVATGLERDPGAIEALRSAGVPVVAVGDCAELGYLEGAIRQGFDAAIAI
jgi:2,4-dienoyl-CoA reductase (NADPH2)